MVGKLIVVESVVLVKVSVTAKVFAPFLMIKLMKLLGRQYNHQVNYINHIIDMIGGEQKLLYVFLIYLFSDSLPFQLNSYFLQLGFMILVN